VRIGEVAEQAGVNVETLRYYERRGLLPEPVRTPGGHREYGEDAVRFVRAVKEAQTLGFALAEIEEYMALARREPSAAAESSRERLQGKLAELDERLGLLRTMRAGVLRALDVRWHSLDDSPATAAYLARRGRDPELDPGAPLHVINGESVAGTLRETSLAGVALSWDDVLHVGPLAFDPAASRPLRARFLAGHGWGDAAAIENALERRDELLARADRVVIWVEHDLFDQLQLLQILTQVDDETEVELVQTDDFLGPLDAAGLEAAWLQRRRVPPVTRRAAREAWRAVTQGRLDVDVPELPHLAAALRRFAEERERPLSRTKRQLLTLLADGPCKPLDLFVANQQHEEAPFLGDSWCFLFLWELAQDGLVRGPLPPPPPLGDERTFISASVELTPEGRQLV
jgi:DNA-binding transcriptional MerR regulator